VVSTREFACVDGTIVKSFSKLRYEENGGEMLAFLPLNTYFLCSQPKSLSDSDFDNPTEDSDATRVRTVDNVHFVNLSSVPFNGEWRRIRHTHSMANGEGFRTDATRVCCVVGTHSMANGEGFRTDATRVCCHQRGAVVVKGLSESLTDLFEGFMGCS
jgi:hypothetical protein